MLKYWVEEKQYEEFLVRKPAAEERKVTSTSTVQTGEVQKANLNIKAQEHVPNIRPKQHNKRNEG